MAFLEPGLHHKDLPHARLLAHQFDTSRSQAGGLRQLRPCADRTRSYNSALRFHAARPGRGPDRLAERTGRWPLMDLLTGLDTAPARTPTHAMLAARVSFSPLPAGKFASAAAPLRCTAQLNVAIWQLARRRPTNIKALASTTLWISPPKDGSGHRGRPPRWR